MRGRRGRNETLQVFRRVGLSTRLIGAYFGRSFSDPLSLTEKKESLTDHLLEEEELPRGPSQKGVEK
jgi:hypothetical protein